VLGDPDSLPPAVRQRRAALGAALVAMPFGSVRWPSIQIGTLAPISRSHGFPTAPLHLNLHFARRVEHLLYERLGDGRAALGEWLFSAEAFGPQADSEASDLDILKTYVSELHAGGATPIEIETEQLIEIRSEVVPAFLDEVVDAVDWDRFSVVGFSSTFQQNAASFALARRLKQRRPEQIMVFGGSNFEGDMGREWARSIPVVDYAVVGEGDRAWPALLAALADGTDPVLDAAVPGVYARRDRRVAGTEPSPPFERMDELPLPDYDDYFERAEALGTLQATSRRVVRIPFESARGCWWGAKRHCTFCGLNGTTMSFRAKSADRVVAELAELARRYRSFDFCAVDNIMDVGFLDDVFDRLAAEGTTYRLFYEVKADLTKDQLRRLRDGGVRQIQPGIESLSSRVLGLMRKGTRASTNVNLLRWCRYYGIHASWNLLWGFPGEEPADYERQNHLIPDLVHLQPAVKETRIVVQRFSPLFNDRDRFPAARFEPTAALSDVYPRTVRLMDAAYDFDVELDNTLPDTAYEETAKLMAGWRAAWATDGRLPSLEWWTAPGLLQIEDRRDPEREGTHTFGEPLASLYLACSEKPAKAVAVRERLGLAHPVEEVEAALDEFCDRGLMMRDGNLFLALAVPAMGGSAYDVDVRPAQ